MIVLFILLLLILFLIMIISRQSQPPIPPEGSTANPSITGSLLSTTPSVTSDPNAPVATPPDRTGGLDPQFTQEEQTLIEQERGLKRRLPYVTADFELSYNYDTDRFEVRLIGTRETFLQWLSTTYPAIDPERFTYLN